MTKLTHILARLEGISSHWVFAPMQLLNGLVASQRRTVEFISGISIRDLLVTAGLVSLLLISSIGVVYSSHLCRQLFAEHSVLLDQRDQLQLEWAQLLLEQSAWSAPARIESMAREELKMSVPEASEIELVTGTY